MVSPINIILKELKMENYSINQINNVVSSGFTDEEFLRYNINGISRCLEVGKAYAQKIYEEGERTGSDDYKAILQKMKSKKGQEEYQNSHAEYTIEKIANRFKISQKNAAKIFEEGKNSKRPDYEAIYSKMQSLREMKNLFARFERERKREKQAEGKK